MECKKCKNKAVLNMRWKGKQYFRNNNYCEVCFNKLFVEGKLGNH